MFLSCDICDKFKFNVKEIDISIGPSRSRTHYICKKCIESGKVPKSFEQRWGISSVKDISAKFVKFVGRPTLTDDTHGPNAFGSVLALYEDGSRLGVICGHGGSMWLCLSCAKQSIKEQEEIDSLQKQSSKL